VLTRNRRCSAQRKILIIDDEVKLLKKIKSILPEGDYHIAVARNGEEGINLLKREHFDLVLTDLIMPGISGYEVMSYVREACPETLVIVITGYASLESVIKAMRNGAYDYITKPFQPDMVRLAIQRAFERIHLQRQLLEATRKLQMLAVTDDLTLLYNIRYFNKRLNVEFERARRYHLPLSCIMLDVDFFKRINDTYGHLKGDDVLRVIARIIKRSIRSSDVGARYGGDEFALLLPQTDRDRALMLAERIRESVGGYDFSHLITDLPHVTISLGIATYPDASIHRQQDLIHTADQVLYRAKQKGRNRIEISR